MNIIVILIMIFSLVADFAIESFLLWLGSLIFPYDFSWLLALFIFILLIILRSIFK